MHGVGRHRADHTVSTRDDVHTYLICGGEISAGGVDVQSVTRAAQDIGVSQSLEDLGSEFRLLVGDGTLAGFSIQALAVARTDPDVAQRYLRILATTLRAVHAHTGATGDEARPIPGPRSLDRALPGSRHRCDHQIEHPGDRRAPRRDARKRLTAEISSTG